MNTQYRVYQDFITRRWMIVDQWQQNEVGPRIVAQGLDEQTARALAAAWNGGQAATAA